MGALLLLALSLGAATASANTVQTSVEVANVAPTIEAVAVGTSTDGSQIDVHAVVSDANGARDLEGIELTVQTIDGTLHVQHLSPPDDAVDGARWTAATSVELPEGSPAASVIVTVTDAAGQGASHVEALTPRDGAAEHGANAATLQPVPLLGPLAGLALIGLAALLGRRS